MLSYFGLLLLTILGPANVNCGCSWPRLVDVVVKLGASVADGIILKADSTGRRGLWVTAPFKAGENLMKLPRSVALGEHQGGKLAGELLDEAPTSIAATLLSMATVALYLEHQASNGGDSGAKLADVWLPCLEDASSEWSAAYFSVDQFKAASLSVHSLQISAASWVIDKLQAQGVDKGRAKWSVHLALSRAFRATTSSGGHVSVLAPLIDMLNHDPIPNVRVDLTQPHFSVTANRDIHAGEELTHRYVAGGSRIFWIIRYGFVPTGSVPDALLDRGELLDTNVRKQVSSLGCPDSLISEGLVQLFSTEAMGIRPLELKCLELMEHVTLGMASDKALEIARNPLLDHRRDKKLGAICRKFSEKFHGKEASRVLAYLQSPSANASLNAHSQEFVRALTAEVDAIALCATSRGDSSDAQHTIEL